MVGASSSGLCSFRSARRPSAVMKVNVAASPVTSTSILAQSPSVSPALESETAASCQASESAPTTSTRQPAATLVEGQPPTASASAKAVERWAAKGGGMLVGSTLSVRPSAANLQSSPQKKIAALPGEGRGASNG
jgi:hypothetical protein